VGFYRWPQHSGEKSAIEKLVESDMEWQHKTTNCSKSINDEHTELGCTFMRFSKMLWKNNCPHTDSSRYQSYINKKIIWGIGGFFIVMILGFLAYGFGQVNWG